LFLGAKRSFLRLGDRRWRGNRDFFDGDVRLKALSAAGDTLERLARVVDFEVFRGELEAALSRSDRAKGGRPPHAPGADVQGAGVAEAVTRCRTTRPNIS
jgi:hypothetical protein